jgi:hypothetical protein
VNTVAKHLAQNKPLVRILGTFTQNSPGLSINAITVAKKTKQYPVYTIPTKTIFAMMLAVALIGRKIMKHGIKAMLNTPSLNVAVVEKSSNAQSGNVNLKRRFAIGNVLININGKCPKKNTHVG